jgi:hypothetical protein
MNITQEPIKIDESDWQEKKAKIKKLKKLIQKKRKLDYFCLQEPTN